ncbi:hypothetical protein BDK51DRAFT_29863 [Blyttiomyces helicus]|uniref:Uncharacterized protein n=1 Tax=Blyttiomyces helicus TaxID=388810 RepID=A0A4P9WJQ8_9FUNG|nr:hypothetical protein BDK51DRAFT_29863 [Blyttiomyces helicus]|eukprot:RKO90886.1 hypothetical protein BDK51DRAFT_29863 [Blyttiomyces helicus]
MASARLSSLTREPITTLLVPFNMSHKRRGKMLPGCSQCGGSQAPGTFREVSEIPHREFKQFLIGYGGRIPKDFPTQKNTRIPSCAEDWALFRDLVNVAKPGTYAADATFDDHLRLALRAYLDHFEVFEYASFPSVYPFGTGGSCERRNWSYTFDEHFGHQMNMMMGRLMHVPNWTAKGRIISLALKKFGKDFDPRIGELELV